ncbi:MAG: rod shape-determining protein MreC [Parcubacteria group bacterium]
MKVNYLPKNRSRNPNSRRIVILVGIFILGAVAFPFLDGVIISIVSPVWKAENAVSRSLKKSFDLFGSQKALVEENASLREKILSLEAEAAALSGGRAEVEALLRLLGRKSAPSMVAAAVLTRPPQTPYDVIVIDAGANESIAIGSKVSLPEGPLVGLVSELFRESAKVQLFSADGQETNAVLERNNVPVILVGTGGGNFRMELPRETRVERGDRVLSLGLDSRHLATVGEISLKPTDSFKEVLAKSPTNIFALRFVFITP